MLIGIFDSLGAQTDRLRCEACQNLILSPMNTGLLRCAVATVLTVYGIETVAGGIVSGAVSGLQQCLPFTVLKLRSSSLTFASANGWLQQCLPFTVLKQ